MAEQTTRHEVIDSDGHVIEPDSVWSEYAEPEFRDVLASGTGGYVQATGITRAYPDMPAEFLTAGTTTGRASPRAPTGRRSRSTR